MSITTKKRFTHYGCKDDSGDVDLLAGDLATCRGCSRELFRDHACLREDYPEVESEPGSVLAQRALGRLKLSDDAERVGPGDVRCEGCRILLEEKGEAMGSSKAAEVLSTIHVYRGDFHKGMIGWRVVVVGVSRGEELLTREVDVGELRDGDRLEVRPVVKGRLSFVSYDAEVGDLEGTGEMWAESGAGKGTEPFLDLGRHEGGGGSDAEQSGSCLDIETATFHASRIARTELCIGTLETRNSDRLDFHEVSAASVKAALIAAFEAGRESEET